MPLGRVALAAAAVSVCAGLAYVARRRLSAAAAVWPKALRRRPTRSRTLPRPSGSRAQAFRGRRELGDRRPKQGRSRVPADALAASRDAQPVPVRISKLALRPARPCSSTGTPNSCDTASMSLTYRWIRVLGRASPLCSDRYRRALPRVTDTNHGKPGSTGAPTPCETRGVRTTRLLGRHPRHREPVRPPRPREVLGDSGRLQLLAELARAHELARRPGEATSSSPSTSTLPRSSTTSGEPVTSVPS